MVVLAAAICTKAGKAVLSRQFVEMSRSRIEGLVASFPKLIGHADQHTYVETDAVRYVYQPLENLFMVLITTKNSNILQDIETLHLFSRVVSEYCRSTDEREIARQAFDLLLVFDEIIALGYRENINLGQIRTISTMESHEERVQAEIERNKEREAKEELKRKAKQIDAQRRDMAKRGYGAPVGGGFGSAGGGLSSPGVAGTYSSGSFASAGSGGSGAFGGNAGGFPAGPNAAFSQSPYSNPSVQPASSSSVAAPAGASGRGMQLGGNQRRNSLLESITAYEGIKQPVASTAAAAGSSVVPQAAAVPAVPQEGLHLAVEEKISVTLNRDGGLQVFDVNGSMTLKVNDSASARARVSVSPVSDPNLRFTTHPKVDKEMWNSESVIGLRDPAGSFPVGQALGILKWKLSSRSESQVPLLINCWPSPTGTGACDVNIEYELQNKSLELHNVVIVIPYPGDAPPKVSSAEGHYQVDRQRRNIQWSLPLIDASSGSGVLEFNVGSDDTSAFFPIQVVFTSQQTLCPVEVTGASVVGGEPRVFSIEKSLKSEAYQVV